jgi:hypothetical protein
LESERVFSRVTIHNVELRGLEPLTPCMPCRCATSCAIAPNFLSLFLTFRADLTSN